MEKLGAVFAWVGIQLAWLGDLLTMGAGSAQTSGTAASCHQFDDDFGIQPAMAMGSAHSPGKTQIEFQQAEYNPATGLPMVGALDTAGNMYGCSDSAE